MNPHNVGPGTKYDHYFYDPQTNERIYIDPHTEGHRIPQNQMLYHDSGSYDNLLIPIGGLISGAGFFTYLLLASLAPAGVGPQISPIKKPLEIDAPTRRREDDITSSLLSEEELSTLDRFIEWYQVKDHFRKRKK
jgi:hypothetical protein